MSSRSLLMFRRPAFHSLLLAIWAIVLAIIFTVRVNPADGLALRYSEVYYHTLAYLGLACRTIDDLRQICAQSIPSLPIRIIASLYDHTSGALCTLMLLYNAAYYLLMFGAAVRAGWIVSRSVPRTMLFTVTMFAFSHIGMIYWLNFGVSALTSGLAQSLFMWCIAECLGGNYRLASGILGAIGIFHPPYWLLSGPLVLYFCWASKSWKSSLVSITLYVTPAVLLSIIFSSQESVFRLLWNMSPAEVDLWWTMVRFRVMHLYLHAEQTFDLILLLTGALLSALFLKAAYCTEADREKSEPRLSAIAGCLDYRVFYAAAATLVFWTLFYLIFVHKDVWVFAAMLLPLRIEMAPAICVVMGVFAVMLSAALPVRFRLLTGATVLTMFFIYNSWYVQSPTKVALCIVILAAGNDYLLGETKETLRRPTGLLLPSVAAFGLLAVNSLDLWLTVGVEFGQYLRVAALLAALGIYVWHHGRLNRRAGKMLLGNAKLSQLLLISMVIMAFLVFGFNAKWVVYVTPAVGLALAITALDALAGWEWPEVIAGLLGRIRPFAMWGMAAVGMIVFAAAYFPSPDRVRYNVNCEANNPLADMGRHVNDLVPPDQSVLVNPGILLTYYTNRKCSFDLELLGYFSVCLKLTKPSYDCLTALPLNTDIRQWARSAVQSRYGPTPANEIPRKFAEFSADQITRLAERWSCGYLVTTVEQRLPFEMLYKNETYALYRIAGH